jgi:hypothetical protein
LQLPGGRHRGEVLAHQRGLLGEYRISAAHELPTTQSRVEQLDEPITVFSYSKVYVPFSKHFRIDMDEAKLLLIIFLHRAYEISPGKVDFFYDNDDENNQIPGDELSDIKIGPK